MFQLFPLVFTFMLAHSPAGILIYWTWSSSLTILQQYVIMHRFGADNPIDSFIAKLRGRGLQPGRSDMSETAVFTDEEIETGAGVVRAPGRPS